MMRTTATSLSSRSSKMEINAFPKHRHLFCVYALGSAITGSSSFVLPTTRTVTATNSRGIFTLRHADGISLGSSLLLTNRAPPTRVRPHPTAIRSFLSNNNNDKKEDGFLSKIANKAKQILPFSKKTEAEIEKKEMTKEIKGNLDKLLKDAPFPIRMLGKMITPLISKIAQQAKEQSRTIQELLAEAQSSIASDPAVREALGEPIRVGSVFGQRSGSVVVNGVKNTQVQLKFEVIGSLGMGTATLAASGGEKASIEKLVLDVGGRQYTVDVTGKRKSGSGGYSPKKSYGGTSLGKNSNIGKDDIIDVEFVEKE